MPTDSEILRRQQLRPSFRLVASDDWRALLRTRANVLVTGPQEAVTAFAYAARSEMREPIRSVTSSAPLFLDGNTLILPEIDALDDAGQQRLIRWMDEPRNAATQIISLTSTPLFSLVRTNRFDPDLYYRLNVIYLEIQGS